jgi:hypothetical protein
MHKNVLAKLTVSLALIMVVAGCAARKPIIKDDLAPGAPKGYVAFAPHVSGYTVYEVRDNREIEAGRVDYYQELRIAKAPGVYVFLVKHQKFTGRVKVTVALGKILYVTIQSQTLSMNTSYSYMVHYSTTTTTTTYNVNLTAGQHYLPINPSPGQVGELLAALDDDDEGTRLAALDALSELYKTNEKMDTGAIADTLQKIYTKERYYWVRSQIKKFLSKIGKPLAQNDEDSIIWDGFTDNIYSHDDLDPWFTNNRTNYFAADGYQLDHDRTDIGWVFRSFKKKTPINFDIELTTTWKEGSNNQAYGLLLGADGKNFYEFGISRNGGARVGLYKNSGYAKNVIPWKQLASLKKANNVLRVEIRGKDMHYFVNGEQVGSVTNEEGFAYKTYGLLVAGKQNISFNLLKITKQ